MTVRESGQACEGVLRLRQGLETARQRDALDLEVEGQLAILPVVAVADPQAETAARLLIWAGAGAVRIMADDIAMVRIVGMAVIPQMAGLVLMFAMAIGVRPR